MKKPEETLKDKTFRANLSEPPGGTFKCVHYNDAIEAIEKERNKSKELYIAATQIIHLHLCEQEHIEINKSKWDEAVNNLSKALHP